MKLEKSQRIDWVCVVTDEVGRGREEEKEGEEKWEYG